MNLLKKNDKENEAPHLCNANRRWKVAKKTYEACLAHDRYKKNKKWHIVAKETHEEYEAYLVTEEEA